MLRLELLGNKHGVIFKEGKWKHRAKGLQYRSRVRGLPAYLLSINMLHQWIYIKWICRGGDPCRLGGLIYISYGAQNMLLGSGYNIYTPDTAIWSQFAMIRLWTPVWR
jgi:hypothetical protein